MTLTTIVILGLLALVGAWWVMTYNGLVSTRNQVENGWKQIDVQLKRRHDLIPNLVEAVKGQQNFESDTLERVIMARQKAVGAHGVAETAAAENQLTQTLGKLFALTEAYPDLKSNQNMLDLQEELSHTENKIAFARQHYNDVVMRFNTMQEVVPSNFVANSGGFKRAEFFEIDEAARESVRIDFSRK